MTRADRMYEWIRDQLAAGRTVYAHTYLSAIKITPKSLDCLRVRDGHLEVQMGRRWDSLMGCKIVAR